MQMDSWERLAPQNSVGEGESSRSGFFPLLFKAFSCAGERCEVTDFLLFFDVLQLNLKDWISFPDLYIDINIDGAL